MTGHVRALSTALTNSVQASAYAIAQAGQGAVTNSTNAIQRVLHYDQLPDWVRMSRNYSSVSQKTLSREIQSAAKSCSFSRDLFY